MVLVILLLFFHNDHFLTTGNICYVDLSTLLCKYFNKPAKSRTRHNNIIDFRQLETAANSKQFSVRFSFKPILYCIYVTGIKRERLLQASFHARKFEV